jgi:hypothetical protein
MEQTHNFFPEAKAVNGIERFFSYLLETATVVTSDLQTPELREHLPVCLRRPRELIVACVAER